MDNGTKAAIIIALATIFAAIISSLLPNVVSPSANNSIPINQRINSSTTTVVPNQPPSINALDSAPSSPQTAGASITWITDASDPDSDQIYYQYILNGNPVADWGRHNEWIWQTSEEYIGNNIIEVLVMDKNHASPSGSDDHKFASFTISSQEPLYETQTSSNQPQNSQPSQPSSNGPIRLSSLGAYYNTFSSIKYDSAADMKIGKKAYKHGVQLETCGFFLAPPSGGYEAFFNLNGEYSHLTGLIGLDDTQSTSSSSGKVTVYFAKEDDIVLDMLNVNPGDLPSDVDIDVSGVNKFIIAASGSTPCSYIDLIDMELIK